MPRREVCVLQFRSTIVMVNVLNAGRNSGRLVAFGADVNDGTVDRVDESIVDRQNSDSAELVTIEILVEEEPSWVDDNNNEQDGGHNIHEAAWDIRIQVKEPSWVDDM